MGLFDRFTSKKPSGTSTPASASPTETAAEAAGQPLTATGVKARLATAAEKLEAKDLPAAMSIYEEVLAVAGDRADVLVTISGDLGAHAHVAEIVELIAPRYDAERHGPATGLNLLQAYLAMRDTDAAQHILDILFSLKRPELEDRLYGFSNALAELLTESRRAVPEAEENGAPPTAPKVGLITISKPIWFYGLESIGDQVLPPKEGRLRRIAFAQLSLPGLSDAGDLDKPEDELRRLSRGVPLWLAETFYFSGNYAPIAALGVLTLPQRPARLMIFGAEWSTDNLRQLVDTTQGGLDYIVTGALRITAGDYDLAMRVYEVKTFRERKKFTAHWTPATADAELGRLHSEVRRFMEWSPASASLAYVPPPQPRMWVDTLGASAGLFLVDKSIVGADLLAPVPVDLEQAARNAASGESASLAYLTLRARAAKLGVAAPGNVALARSALVQQAQQAVGA